MNNLKARKPKSPTFLGAICACVVGLMLLTWYVVRGKYDIYNVENRLSAGVENPGATIDVVELDNTVFSRPFGYAIPSQLAIRVQTPTRSFWLHSLNDLQGSVSIYTKEQALIYVRLITGISSHYAGISDALDIYSQSGLTPGSEVSLDMSTKPGYYGILSDAVYRSDGFTPASVSDSDGVYHIHRWVCMVHMGYASGVEYWDETVHHDGAYSRRVVISKPAPMSHGEMWILPLRK